VDARGWAGRIYARGGLIFCQLAKDVNLLCQIVGVLFFFFCQKNKDAKAFG
jgi:hypothetical protein